MKPTLRREKIIVSFTTVRPTSWKNKKHNKPKRSVRILSPGNSRVFLRGGVIRSISLGFNVPKAPKNTSQELIALHQTFPSGNPLGVDEYGSMQSFFSLGAPDNIIF